jgi:NADPH:quinone reductase-like Zn-dependent oxidoreductase
MPRFGGYSDTVVVPAGQALRLPERMSFEEGAALPVVYLTAHHMLLFTGTLRPGMSVLIHSAAGGVGVAAVQICKAHGCVLFGTASPGKHDFLRQQGCQHPLDPGSDWPATVRRLVGERGLDLVLDPIGGRSFRTSYDLLGPAGRLVLFGASAVMSPGKTRSLWAAVRGVLVMPRFHPISLMNDNKTVTGVNLGHLFDRLDLLQPQMMALLAMYERGEIKPHIDRTFRFTEAAAAHHYLHDRKAKGKVLLVP